MKTARQLAVETLLRVEEGGAWSNLTLDHMIRQNGLDRRDGAFATAIVYGVLERKLTLDACIRAHSKTRPDKLSPVILMILRSAIYQLLYMDKIPDHSAVSEAVELAKKMRMAKASGFVNGVLRSFLREEKAIPLPEDRTERLSVRYSVPLPLLNMWLKGYGEAMTMEILEASLRPAPIHLRVNCLKTTASDLLAALAEEGIAAVESEIPGCLILSGQGALQQTKAYEEGLFHIQDVSSQLCAMAVQAAPGLRVLDACAAPGGKSFTLAQFMENCGELVATELHEKRVALMAKQAARLGITNMRPTQADMTIHHPELGQFDRILCDVPCSGLGVIRRKPEIKYKPLEEFDGLPEIQYKILSAASQYCKVGGLLTYSTCTLNPAENGDITQRFLAEHPEFAPSPLPLVLGGGWEKTLTGEYGGDHFYIAGFERKSN